LTFVPFHVVHPVRIAHLRPLTTAALIAWALLATLAVAKDLDPGPWVASALCLLAIYFVGVGFLRRRRP
jgi:phosphatidylcholine synthase